jgi:hypothetical protein
MSHVLLAALVSFGGGFLEERFGPSNIYTDKHHYFFSFFFSFSLK